MRTTGFFHSIALNIPRTRQANHSMFLKVYDVYDRFACHDSKTNLSSVVTHASRALDVANRGFDYEHSTDLPVGRLLNDIGALYIMENISRAALYLSLIKKGVLIFPQTYTEFQKECGIDGPLDGDDVCFEYSASNFQFPLLSLSRYSSS
ncbi:hypothetical protein C8R41DRAFT_982384 [Lentinula lateritia]|uniref:Uncharacterized protein n=1 Tax=Lentinula lateritia TaxID=40482 RepID=A0ABQ8VDF2_9AGAR|nr:hypothetical protein C8R41DRAFT_982384 [Lentinula lateritia]